ncbi:MAG TPA: hypothetical protein VGB24_24285 [Longimicrobium sp.]|jgi:hypothetical protein|uniref:hypothetical protein n=1 Tax=Longimicrobium sp. TaxID=2029185 RepID=UPI002EDB7D7A
MAIPVFLSVGRTFTREQEQFVADFESFLRVQGLEPETVGRNYVKNQQPLRSIEECMRKCSGAVILAFERVYIEIGEDKRGSSDAEELRGTRVPTVWNQVEAAMAYALGLPLLVIVERGLRSEGLLEKGYDWYVKWIRLDPSALSDRELLGLVADWKSQMQTKKTEHTSTATRIQAPRTPGEMSVGELLASLKPAHLWATITALVMAAAAIASVAYTLGGLRPPAS